MIDKIDKNNRTYIIKYFNKNQKFNEGDILEFEMPPFCSGDYLGEIHIDNDGDAYIDKDDDFFKGCRDFFIRKNSEI